MRDKGIKIRDTLKQHILNNKKRIYSCYVIFFGRYIFGSIFLLIIYKRRKEWR